MLDKYAVDSLADAIEKVPGGYEQDEGLRELVSKPSAVRLIGHVLIISGMKYTVKRVILR